MKSVNSSIGLGFSLLLFEGNGHDNEFFSSIFIIYSTGLDRNNWLFFSEEFV